MSKTLRPRTNPLFHQNVGALLRINRKRQGWTQKNVSFASGISASQICRIEAGYNHALETLMVLCEVLGISLGAIVTVAEGSARRGEVCTE